MEEKVFNYGYVFGIRRRRGEGGGMVECTCRGDCGVDGIDLRVAGHATCPNMACPEYCRISL